jgi:hypothetical protein
MRTLQIWAGVALASSGLAGFGAEIPAGIWRSEGYGEVIDVASDRFRHFEVTDVSCVERPVKPRMALRDAIGTAIAGGDGSAAVTVRRGISLYVWQRLEKLPSACVVAEGQADARRIVDVLWHTFDEHYAFFALRRVDWSAMRQRAQARVSEVDGEDPLFALLTEMLAPLQDRHVRLTAGERTFASGGLLARGPDPDGLSARYSHLQPALRKFLAEGLLAGGLKATANDQVWWGRIEGGIGYVALQSLWDFSGREQSNQDIESTAAEAAMDEVLRDLGCTRGIIVDLRFNGGGSDAVGLAIAGRFADRARVAFSKQARVKDRLTPAYDVHVAPSTRRRFEGPVVALIGPLTASGAEVMTLGLMALPNVTLVGRRTMGLFSDTLYRRLPNGWGFTLSNEIYRTPAGDVFEGVGIAPRIESDAAQRPASVDERFGRDIRRAHDLLIAARGGAASLDARDAECETHSR